MSSNQVSFQGRVPIPANTKIKNASAEVLSSAINNVHHLLGSKPVRESSGKSMIVKNLECFDPKTHCLNSLGQNRFNKVNEKQLGVTADSNLSDFMKAMSNFIRKNADEDGTVYRSFDTFMWFSI